MATVYLLGDWTRNGVYKIGVTRGDLNKRIKKLQTGNSGEIFVCQKYTTDYPFFIEKNLHLKFHGNNIRNEWFELTNENVLKFKTYCEEIERMIEILKDNPFMKNLK